MRSTLLHEALATFRVSLSAGFEVVRQAHGAYAREAASRPDDFAEDFEEFFADWAQCQWELLVERVVCAPDESLPVYGAGSDYAAAPHARVFFHDLLPTHEVIGIATGPIWDELSGELLDLSTLEFHQFVARRGAWYECRPPFDHVSFRPRDRGAGVPSEVVVAAASCRFELAAIQPLPGAPGGGG